MSAIAYRVGTHAQFRQSLLARLAAAGPALNAFTTRHGDDFTVGLLDAWSTVADVLTFYQERIANESFLRTATERFSVLEMARLIGYELQPGVAASAYLAFTLDDTAGAFAPQLVPGTTFNGQADLASTTITPELKVQSIPGPGELVQTFETIETIEARAEWNAMKPRLTQPQPLSVTMGVLLLQGTGYALKQGDVILINKTKLRKILNVSLDETAKTTRVDFVAEASFPAYVAPASPAGQVSAYLKKPALTGLTVKQLLQSTWREGDIAAMISANRWSATMLATSFSAPPAPPKTTAENGVQAFRKRAFFFGYNAPYKVVYTGTIPGFQEWAVSECATRIFLDTAYEELLPGGVIAIQGADEKLEDVKRIIDVQQVDVRARTDYGLSIKSTALTVAGDWRQLIASSLSSLASLRGLTVYAQSEPLTVADIPIVDLIEGNSLTLGRYYPGLRTGQKLLLIGTPSDLPGVVASEVLIIKDVSVTQGFTIIGLEKALTNAYVRSSVTFNGNVALATQGETVRESLGSGNASQVFQRFVLRQPPLTYLSGATTSGAATTLEIRVNEVLWHEAASLLGLGPQEKVYTTHTDNEGKTTVMFGDGITGARLPTGTENVKVKYRKGLGLDNLVNANQLSQLVSRPLGVKGVNNPLAAQGGAEQETLDDARRNAPLQVLTLGRIVSLQDYADFARSFAGIDKALATWTWVGQRRRVFVTVAGSSGAIVDEQGMLYKNLLQATRQAGDPNVSVVIATYDPVYFQVAASVKVNPDYLPATVLPAVEAALRQQLSFAARDFGQPLAQSTVVAVIQRVPGVVAVELEALFRTDQEDAGTGAGLTQPLEATVPRPGDRTVLAAELLLLDPRPVKLRLMS
ncbi:putative baseplate assembly protein [Hymenobacter bucti]|uniref:Baseplate assembly protein n=1 Tax=Hymenobacter bucti TaxID=1844114 RepID=A0ABW4R2B1_9BACT